MTTSRLKLLEKILDSTNKLVESSEFIFKAKKEFFVSLSDEEFIVLADIDNWLAVTSEEGLKYIKDRCTRLGIEYKGSDVKK